VTKQAGLLHEGTRWGSGCTFVDYDRDGTAGSVRRKLSRIQLRFRA
jgi:hypothetical protein